MRPEITVIAILVGLGFAMVILLFIIIMHNLYAKPIPYPLISRSLVIARKKCEEYAKVACDNPIPSDKISQDEPSPNSRGRKVDDGVYPHMAWLDTPERCAGALISEYFVMTSATCMKDSKEGNFRVKIGTADLLGAMSYNKEEDLFNSGTGTVYTAEKVTFHEKYDYKQVETWQYAIALIKLGKKVEFDWRKRPICLYSQFSSIGEENMTTCRWGINEAKIWMTQLHALDQYSDPDMERLCASSFPSVISKLGSMICAGNSQFNEGICAGDTGAPLQIPLKRKDVCAKNTYEQIGVALASNRVCTPPLPKSIATLYIRAEPFIDWIVSHVWPETVEN